MSGAGPRSSCRNLFRKLSILPTACQYILSLMMFIVDNQKDFLTNAYIHGLDTRNKNHLYLPAVSLFCVQKGVLYTGVKTFNSISKVYRVIETTGKDSKRSYTGTLLFIPFIQLLNF